MEKRDPPPFPAGVSKAQQTAMEQDEPLWQPAGKVLAPALHGFPPGKDAGTLSNPSGRFVSGVPEAAAGPPGRKLMAGRYGVFAPHEGGVFCRKKARAAARMSSTS